MAIGMDRKQKVLDGKLCFDLWIERGSLGKVAKVLRDEFGLVTSKGKLFTRTGISDSAWTYALENMVEARKGVGESYKANGQLLTDKEWYILVVRRARSLYGRKRFDKFIEKHSYLTPYL